MAKLSKNKTKNLTKEEKIKALEDIIQVVLISIPKEIEAAKLYRSAAEYSISQDVKELLLNLSAQEKEHEEKLRRILSNLKAELSNLKSNK